MRRLYIILACLIFCITTYADVRNKLFYYTNPSTPFSYIFDVALVGGGINPQPGEISLAHNGVLFADEQKRKHLHNYNYLALSYLEFSNSIAV